MKYKEIKQEDITLEAALLKAMATKSTYKKFIACLDRKKLIPTVSLLLDDYNRYYTAHESESIDWQLFYTEFSHNWHKDDLDPADLEYYRTTVFPLIQNSVVDNGTYIALLERDTNLKIKESMEKELNPAYINDLLSSFAKNKAMYLNEKDDTIFTLDTINLEALDPENGVPWFLSRLQSALGGLMPGQFVLVSADSDVGKSAFCISQAVHTFLNNKTNRPILYCTSEDTREDLTCRFFSCLYKDKVPGGFEDIIKQQQKILAHYTKEYNPTLFIGMPIRSPSDLFNIKQKVEFYKPCLVVIDLLDKLSTSDNIQDLTRLYQDIRGLANDGYPILATTQAGNTSYYDKNENKYKHRKWLTDKDTANSKGGGKQGAAYCMIMIGKDDESPNMRYITTTKKKRGKHVRLTCELQDKYSYYKELI